MSESNFSTGITGIPTWAELEDEAKRLTAERVRILRDARKGVEKDYPDEDSAYFAGRFQRLLDEGKRVQAFATVCEAWLRWRNIPFVDCRARRDSLWRELDPDVAREYFERYHQALGADRYKVVCRKGNLTMSFHAKCGARDGLEPNELGKKLARLVEMNEKGDFIYFIPISDDYHFILVSDVTEDAVVMLINLGVAAAYVQETESGVFEMIVKIRKTGDAGVDRRIGNEWGRTLNLMAGDCMPGGCREHLAPGFVNPEGCMTVVGETAGVVCEALGEYGEWEMANRPPAVTGVFEPEPPVKADISEDEGIALYNAHQSDILRITVQSPEEADLSAVDLRIATRLRATGHSQEEVENILATAGKAQRPQAHNWPDYSRRTAAKAFADDSALLKYERWIASWREIEVRVLARSKPEARAFGPP